MLDLASCEIMVFSTPWGLYHFKTLTFELHGPPAAFQQLMDNILHPHWAYTASCLDSVIIFVNTWMDHLQHLRKILQSICTSGLVANLSKCCLGYIETKYLGYIPGSEKIMALVDKVRALVEPRVPMTKNN